MIELLLVAIIGLSVIVCYQDFRFRAIHVLLPVALLLASLAFESMQGTPIIGLTQLLANSLYLLLLFLGLAVFIRLKRGAWQNPLRRDIGLGDWLFLVAVAPLFSFTQFVFFFLISGVLLLLASAVIPSFRGERGLPMAGFQAGVLCVCLVVSSMTGVAWSEFGEEGTGNEERGTSLREKGACSSIHQSNRSSHG